MSSENFSWQPIGGLGEVGMNCMVFHFGRLALPVDAGIMFAEHNDFGIDVVFPDYYPLIEKHSPKYWLITHAHEDHIGAVPDLLKIYEYLKKDLPVFYAPPFAAALIREKLQDEERIVGGARFLKQIKTVELNSKIFLEDVEVTFVETRHSTVDSCSLALEWKSKTNPLKLIHTADFKIDEKALFDGVKDRNLYRVFGDSAIDFLFIDSTNSEREGHSVSESQVAVGLESLIRAQSGRVYVTLFSSNVYRIAVLMNIAKKIGRTVCLAGRSLQTAHRLAQDLNLYGSTCPDISDAPITDLEHISRLPPGEQLILCSGSQGEMRSVLARLANDRHAELLLEENDSVIFSSKLIPGNEKAVSRVINGLLRQGAKVLFGEVAQQEAGGPIHASGHARQDEIKMVMELLKPKNIIPVHGELRQLRTNAALALKTGQSWGLKKDNIFVVEDGTKLIFSREGEWRLSDRLYEDYTGKLLKFEGFVCHSRDTFLKVRKTCAMGGVASGWISATGKVGADIRGQNPYDNEDLLFEIKKWLMSQYFHLKSQRAFNGPNPGLEVELAEEMGRFIRRSSGLRPFCFVHLVHEGD